MRLLQVFVLLFTICCSVLSIRDAALAAPCPLPNQLTNGQVADATQVMTNFAALVTCLNSAPAGSTNALQFNAGGGSFGGIGPLSNGQLLIGSTGSPPQAATLTAGPGIAISNGAGGITITATSGGGASYDPVILAEGSLLHYWPMSDAAGSTTIADLKGGAPMAVSDTLSNVVLGNPGPISDGTTGLTFLGAATKTNGIVLIPAAMIPASGDYTVEFVFKNGGYLGYAGVPAAMMLTIDYHAALDLYIDGNRTGAPNAIRGDTGGTIGNFETYTSTAPTANYHIALVASSAAGTVTTYLNGLALPVHYTGAIGRQNGVGQLGSYGPTSDSNPYAYRGAIEKFAIYGSALPASSIAAHYAASGLR